MNYQEALESAFLDELEKIAVAPIGFFKSMGRAWSKAPEGAGLVDKLRRVGKVPLAGSSLGTHAARGAIGAVPGAVAGFAAAPEGGGIGGAVKGGLIGGAAGIAGGAALQHRALGRAAAGKAGLAARNEARAILPKAGPALEKAVPAAAPVA